MTKGKLVMHLSKVLPVLTIVALGIVVSPNFLNGCGELTCKW